MRELLGPLGEPSILNQISRFELFTDGRAAQIELTHPDLIIERSTLIRSLPLKLRKQAHNSILAAASSN